MSRTMIAALSTAMLVFAASRVRAEEDEYFRPVDNDLVKKECSACHMAYPAGMLPAASWKAVMGDLPNHFGEDASLDEASRTEIETWLVANAAPDKSRLAKRSVDAQGQPALRISETQWWIRAHDGEISPRALAKAGSKANCAACHRGAEKGYFEDD